MVTFMRYVHAVKYIQTWLGQVRSKKSTWITCSRTAETWRTNCAKEEAPYNPEIRLARIMFTRTSARQPSLNNWPLWTGRNPYTSTIQTAWVASEETTTPWWWQWLAETCWGKSTNALTKSCYFLDAFVGCFITNKHYYLECNATL
jgi:hypothetical protein